MTPLTLGDAAAQLRDLPAIPAAVASLLDALRDGDATVAALARVIGSDPAVAARVLRVANSSFYGMSREIATLESAAAVLGLRTLKSIAVAASLPQALTARPCVGFDMRVFWRHALGTALCARELASAIDHESDDAFTLGLLHDIGRMLIASRFPAYQQRLLDTTTLPDEPSHEREQALIGIDHASIGGLAAERWKFALPMVEAIALHHSPPDDDATSRSVDLLHIADNMAHALDLAGDAAALVPPLALSAWERLGMSQELCETVMKRVDQQHPALVEALAV